LNSPTIPPKALATNNSSASRAAGGAHARERAVLVQLRFPGLDLQAELEELRQLVQSAGADACAELTGKRERPDIATYIGKGKAEELRDLVASGQIDVVIVNHDLSPAQERNLEKIACCRVLDRNGLILDIFAQRAHSHEGKLQVELAQLEHLSTLTRRLEEVRAQRLSRRKARHKIPIPTVSLVGYTNAGKSTLFNRLTGAGVYAADQLFATLDPTMRRVSLAGNAEVILADTVGFIRHLPHQLVEAFKSTLEEVAEADLLLHVVDGSSPERREQIEQVQNVLREIEADHIPQVTIFNKIDLTGESPRLERDESGRIARVFLSAHTGAGIELLLEALSEQYRRDRVIQHLRLPPQAGRLRARIYEHLNVLHESLTDKGEWVLDIELSPADLAWLMSLTDFSPEWMLDAQECVLARTGS
jgi:GTP-binding protein HflX